MSKETDYNGWSNKATWLVNVWMNNDYNLYIHYLTRLNNVWENTPDYNERDYAITEEFKEIVQEVISDEHRENGLAYDLLQYSFNSVNWSELIKHYINELGEASIKNQIGKE
jgi:hypothetical protein